MPEKIIVGPFQKGLKKNIQPFYIDNDSFPVLINAYEWRGRIKRKRGTSKLGILTRFFDSTSTSYTSTSSFNLSSGAGNLLTGFSLEAGSIVPGSVSITVGANTYTDSSQDGTLDGNPVGSGTINYASGTITISGGGASAVSGSFRYYPNLPVMGLEDLILEVNQSPLTLAFDTTYSYRILNTSPYSIYDVTFYKNLATAFYTGYTAKTDITNFHWNGQDYQNFSTVNYEGALWATNGITIPFDPNVVGMQFAQASDITNATWVDATTMTFDIAGNILVIGDFVFLNEWVASTTAANKDTLNFQTGYVTNVAGNTITVKFPNAAIANDTYSGGIIQYLTNVSDASKDCIKWYDGDPTDGSPTAPVLNGGKGWVNFCPPVCQSNFEIAGKPSGIYYLVTARHIIPFKDRLLFIGPVIQTSTGSPIYLQDTIIYSQNGTPYYTASFSGDVNLATTVFNQILVPTNQTAQPTAYFSDSVGYGGFVSAGLDQKINTTQNNEDVLILGLDYTQSRLIYTSNEILPFQFYTIDSELGTSSPFSAVNLGKSVLSRGNRGYAQTTQQVSARFDLNIPDEVYECDLTQNGTERIIAVRDYINEWIYFSYASNQNTYRFPTRTLLYNYSTQSWGYFEEAYTTYGTFRKRTGYTWATIGQIYPTWSVWNDPWSAGASTLFQPEVIGGNQQGYVLIREEGTGEGNSLYIKNISFPSAITGATQASPCVLTSTNTFVVGQKITITDVEGMTELNDNTYTITAVSPTTITINVDSSLFTPYTMGGTATPTRTVYMPDHCLEEDDYIVISNAIGTVSSQINGKVFSVSRPTLNEFDLSPEIDEGTYLGLGEIKKAYQPVIQTKQFPPSWGAGKKTRLGVQQYLFTRTSQAQIQLLLYKSQNSNDPYNDGNILPSNNVTNDGLIYSSVLNTCVEGANLGLTALTSNLQQLGSTGSAEVWHRKNTPIVGDTVQIGFTLSDAQMRDPNLNYQFAEIELHGFILDVYPSQVLA